MAIAFAAYTETRLVKLNFYYTLPLTHIANTVQEHQFCRAAVNLEKATPTRYASSDVLFLEQSLRRSFLPNFTLALTPPSALVRLQAVYLHNKTVTLDLSQEFYQLSAYEETAFIGSLLLNLHDNFPELSEVFISIDGHNPAFLHSAIYYQTPFTLMNLPQTLTTRLKLSPTAAITRTPCPTY